VNLNGDIQIQLFVMQLTVYPAAC